MADMNNNPNFAKLVQVFSRLSWVLTKPADAARKFEDGEDGASQLVELTDDDKNQCIGTGIIKILVGEVGAMTIAVGKDGVDLTLLQFLKEFERGLAGAPSDDMREDFCERAEISVQESLIKQLTIADCLEPHVFVEGLEATDERDTFYLCCGS
eukprot:m.565447 g.565447  ORF g.565447 m.565447 type:complete len:154 (+) comp22242_c0_seq23:266-727(+)